MTEERFLIWIRYSLILLAIAVTFSFFSDVDFMSFLKFDFIAMLGFLMACFILPKK